MTARDITLRHSAATTAQAERRPIRISGESLGNIYIDRYHPRWLESIAPQSEQQWGTDKPRQA
jgi:hypothetical protein